MKLSHPSADIFVPDASLTPESALGRTTHLCVAAHQDDLAGARKCGLQTAYIERPLEFGPKGKDISPDPANTWHAQNLVHLADLLGA